jgi:hypothetical protein
MDTRSRLDDFLTATRRVVAISSVIVAVAVGAGGAASAQQLPPKAIAVTVTAEPYNNRALVNELAENAADLDAITKILDADAPATSTLAELHETAMEAIDLAQSAATPDEAVRLAIFGSLMTADEREITETTAIVASESATEEAIVAAADWEAEVEAKNARIVAASAAAEAARVAVAAEAARAYNNSSSSGWGSAGAPSSRRKRNTS